MLTDTISILEAVSMFLVLIGSGLVGFCWYLVWGDLQTVRDAKGFRRNGAKHRVAKRNVRTESAKLSTMLFFVVAIGILMTLSPRDNNPVHIGSVVTIGAILWSFIVMIADSAFYLWDRSAILNLLQTDSERQIEPAARTRLVQDKDGGSHLIVPVDIDESEG